MDNTAIIETMKIANTILKQIKAIDYWALGAWGANQYVSMSAGASLIGPILGGVQFKIKTPKYMKDVRVLIYYTADDLYTVRVVRCIGMTCTEIKTVAGVFFDQLVEIIDDIIENKK